MKKEKILINSKEIVLDMEVAEGCTVLADSFYLEQAIKNYLGNAVSHTKPVSYTHLWSRLRR